MKPRLLVPLCAALALVAPTAGAATTSPARSARPLARAAANGPALALQAAFVSVYRQISPSVVQIETNEGLGSGIVFDGKGDIVTNAHVVGDAKTFKVTTPAGKILQGTLVGEYQGDDLAVIRVSGDVLRPASFADSSRLQVGDIAMAIGNPLGLQSSFTEGIVSALGRDEDEGHGVTLRNSIQTSAAINPGNSGGALVDLSARVIGIPTLAANDPQLGGAAAGIGFAIPGNDVRDYANQIIAHGKVTDTHRAYLGVRIGETSKGVYIGDVTKGGPAGKAGLTAGDVIVSVNGRTTQTLSALSKVLAGLAPGRQATLGVIRQSGSKTTVTVTLGTFPGS
jgi:S1-C subfamily serine protease